MASDPRDLHERLKPFRRILDDLAEAVDVPAKMREEAADLTRRCVELRDEEARLSVQTAAAREALAVAERDHAQRLAEERRAFETASAKHREALARLVEQRTAAETEWAERLSTLEHEYANARDDYRAKETAARERLEALRAEENAMAERLAPLLSRSG